MTPWYIFAFLSVVCSLVYGLVSKSLLNNKDDHDPITYASVLFFTVAVFSTIAYVLTGGNLQSDLAAFTNHKAVIFLVMNVLLYSIATSLYWRALKKLPASEVSIFFDLTVAYIFIFGVLFGLEAFSITRMFGGLLIVGAVLLLAFGPAKNDKFRMNKYLLMLLVSTVFYALAALTDNIIISNNYFSLLFFQILSFALPALILVLLNRKTIAQIRKITKPSVMKYEVFNAAFLFCGFYAVYLAYDAGGVTSEVNFVLATETILTVIFATILLKERNNIPMKIVSAILATIGIFLLI